MNLGLRAILLAIAAVLFLIGVFSDLHQGDFICWGLLVMAVAFVVSELGLEDSMSWGGTRRET